MTRMTIQSKIGPDGVLHLDVPVSVAAANQEVQVTIEPVPAMTQEEWRRRVLASAGSIPDPTFMRHEQGQLEQRDPLP